MPELTVGSTVHYTDNPNHGGGHVRCFNAEVTSVYPLGYVDVRNPLTGKACGIREGKPGDLYTWHWPEPVNAVNRSVSVATVRKLRSAADALWADASTQGPALRDALQTEADAIFKRADSIEEQVRPKEPTAFGSIVRADCAPGLRGIFWQKAPLQRKHYWESTGGAVALWSELTNVEVLRVGIGPKLDPHVATMLDAFQKPVPTDADEFMVSAGFDPTPAQEASYLKGVEDFAAKVRRELAALRSTVVTAPEKRTCDDALALVAALLGES